MAERPALSVSKLSEEKLLQNIKGAFQHWHTPRRSYGLLEELLLVRHIQLEKAEPAHRVINELLLANLKEFDGEQANWAEALRMRYPDGQSVRDVARIFNVEDGTIQRWQQGGWKELAKMLFAKEQALRTQNRTRLLARIEQPTYTQLWGVDDHLQTLTDLITDPDGPQIIAIEGIGGIGKTSLTNALMNHLIETDVIGHGHYMGCAWVTARNNMLTVGGEQKAFSEASLTGAGLTNELATQLFAEEGRPIRLEPEQLLSMLKHRLAEQPHLIVVDNLETVEDTDTLIEMLRRLIDPTRILLTTRQNLFNQPDIYHYPIGQLGLDDALALIRFDAKQRNLPMLAKASDNDLRPIFQTAGGNPLALRLIVGQTHVHALHNVLDDLTEARGKTVGNLYTYIYWNAWNSLNELAREAWLLMPLVNGSGMSLDQLDDFTEMEMGDLRHALNLLVTLNLIEHHADLKESRYFIHSLTRSFLQSQVLKWGEGDRMTRQDDRMTG